MQNLSASSDPADFDDEAFEVAFTTFDEDGSGTVEKEEMLAFIKSFLQGPDEIDEEEDYAILDKAKAA